MTLQGKKIAILIAPRGTEEPEFAQPKAAVEQAGGDVTAIEYAARGVRANAVSPGITETPMHPPETRAGLGRFHPLGRMGTVADVVGAVLYLKDATFVTGEILHVDGGQMAGH